MRGLTSTECTTYGFADACPGLQGLRGEAAQTELVGDYELSWTAEELLAVIQGQQEDASGGPLSLQTLHEFEAWASDMAGDYRVQFAGGTYRITRDGRPEPFCRGSLRVGEGTLALGADEGTGRVDFDQLQAGFTLTGDELRLDADGFRGAVMDRLLWTSKPLVKVS